MNQYHPAVEKKAAVKRKERRAKWEAMAEPEAIVAADNARLTALRLKFRLGSLVASAKNAAQDRMRIKRQDRELKRGQKTMHGRLMLQQAAAHGTRDKISKETRCVQIAHGFMRGRTYAEMEQICWTKPDWVRILEIITQHCHGNTQAYWQRYEQWYQAAKRHLLDGSFKGYEPSQQEIINKLRRKRGQLEAAIAESGG